MNEISPNATPSSAVTDQPAVPSLDSIADKMTAMRQGTERNQMKATEQPATGQDEEANDTSGPEVLTFEEEAPEVEESQDNIEEDTLEADAQDNELVSTDDSENVADELIDFIEFSETNPNAKFKFMRNGKEVIIDSKKAAAILGQGSAIHEDARQLKIDRAEFDESMKDARARQEGLNLAMEFTVQPKLQKAYDEILKTQQYQTVFNQQLRQTNDPAEHARIQASMQQNEQYINGMQQEITSLQPAVTQFRSIRAKQVTQHLESARKNFTDKELKNQHLYQELRDNVSKIWKHAKAETIPGVANIDLISSDEEILSLVRDGLRYRDKPKNTRSAGSSMAQLTNRKGGSQGQRNQNQGIDKLREQANSGDKKAADNLLVAQLNRIRQQRGGR
jgi:hypothetical protein|tara:strand:- start:8451 stop:9626 length:1176 start_codon:yes stop_codon:yes gene_type:complete